MTPTFGSLLDQLGGDLWWIGAAGLAVAGIAFFFGSQFLTRGAASRAAAKAPAEERDPYAVGSETERRHAFRRKGSSIGVELAEASRPKERWEGWVLDRSVGGLGLCSEKQVVVGTQLLVRPTNAPPMAPAVEVAVHTCQAGENGWHLNCEFLKSPPYSVLLLFG